MIRNITLVCTGVVLAAGSFVFAASWQGTSSIRDGSIINASIISNNFDFLYDRVSALENSLNNINISGDNSSNSPTESIWNLNKSTAYYDGNVAIGTAAAGMYSLYIKDSGEANIFLDSVTSNGNSAIRFANGSGQTWNIQNAGWRGNDLLFIDRTDNEALGLMIQNGTQYVGVGEGNPSTRLDVAGKVSAEAYCNQDGYYCVTALELRTALDKMK